MELNFNLHVCYDKINHIYESCFLIVDKQIARNLKDGQIDTRPVKSNGLWCFTLLPTVIILYRMQHDVSPVYSLITCLSVGLLFYCLLFITLLFFSCMVLRDSVPGGFVVSSLITSLIIYFAMGKDLLFAMSLAWPTIYLFSVMLKLFIVSCPKTFTIGEAMIVAQAIVLFAALSLANVFYFTWDTEFDVVNVSVYTVLYTVCLMIAALYFLEDSKRNMTHLCYIIGAGAVFCLTVLHVLLGRTCIYDILCYVFMNQKRVQLFLFWLTLTLLASFVLVIRTKLAVKANTVTRKTFHLLASMVFMSGILLDVQLTRMAAGIGLGVLILVEALRKSGIEPIASALHSAFLVYCDDKDCGTFAMTPLYMYCGLSGGLVAAPGALERLAGVLAVGVGDTAASWFGSRYGCNKWPGGTRTLEGTAFNILSQVATVYALQLFDLLTANYALIRTFIAATVSGLVEAQTDQVDNLVLPLVTTIAFQATWFLS